VITVYGATGYTGKLIAELLVQRSIPFTIAGRNRERMNELRGALARHGSFLPEVEIAALSDRTAMDDLAKRSKVILSCAGPFAEMGPPVIDACLRGGAHYLDITGEVRFMAATGMRDAEARAAKVALVNAVGFDVVPTDLCVFLAKVALGDQPEEIDLALAASGARPSAGTTRTLLNIVREGAVAYEDGRYVEEAIASKSKTFDFLGIGPAPAFNAPIGDVATAPRTTGAKRVRAYVRMPSWAGRMATKVVPASRALLKSPLGKLISSTVPAAGEGPSLEQRNNTRFSIVAEARADGRVGRARMSGRDAYGLTAECAVAIAVLMDRDDYRRSGALSPMQAAEPAMWRELFERLGCAMES
jgi:saccharopine dehydrogenase (NAD+, L-lysine-forming)